MKPKLTYGLSEKVMDRIEKHSAGAEHLKSQSITCHYCEHKTIVVYEDSSGHIKAKCSKCGKEAIYNVALCLSEVVAYR